MAQFHEAGYCVVPQAVTSTEVDALREECTLLCADHALKKRSLLESGCVMDLFRDVQIPDESRCRVDTDEYLQLRAKALKVFYLARSALRVAIVNSSVRTFYLTASDGRNQDNGTAT